MACAAATDVLASPGTDPDFRPFGGFHDAMSVVDLAAVDVVARDVDCTDMDTRADAAGAQLVDSGIKMQCQCVIKRSAGRTKDRHDAVSKPLHLRAAVLLEHCVAAREMY